MAWRAKCRARPFLASFISFKSLQQMAEAFLFEPVLQSTIVVGQEPIGGQDARKVAAQDVEDHIAAAVGPDGVDGQVRVSENPQPGRECANPPAGLIDIHDAALADGLQEFFIDGSSRASQLLICLAPAAAADRETKGIIENFTDFAIRDAQAILEVGRQGFGTRSHHDPGRARGLRALFGMLRAYPLVAGVAVAAVGHKAGCLHFHHRNVA